MARSYRTHLPPGPPEDEDLEGRITPRHLNKQEFAQRLYALMMSKGWHQSELARRAGLNRDAISVYMRGKSLPSPKNLRKLATALGVGEDRLLPNMTEAAIAFDKPAFDLKISPNDPGRAWLRLDRSVSTKTAFAISDLLRRDDEALDAKGSRRAAAVQRDED